MKNEKIKISTKNLNVFYGAKQALFDVNLELVEKKVTALIGPSGCGKSTYIRCLNRMNDVIDICKVEGSIKIDGQEINKKDVDVNLLREKVGMVFQKPNPFPKSIYDNIAYGPRIHGLADNKDDLDKIVEGSLTKIEELIDELKKTYTIVIVTHSMSQAARVSQNTGFFHLGKILEFNLTEKIFKNPDNKLTQDYITGRFG